MYSHHNADNEDSEGLRDPQYEQSILFDQHHRWEIPTKDAQYAHKRNEKTEHGRVNCFPRLALPSADISTAIAKLLAQARPK